ncbi:MAG: EamA family transporter, partial [Firmicutes bacterium]|nr:EamA family transporter [Bacillota bacterium]
MRKMTRRNAEILLIIVIALRSTALLFSKIALATMGPLTLLSIRFLLAFVILFAIFCKRMLALRPATLLRGLILGGLFYATMASELIGLQYTTTSTTAFLENTAIMLVPLFDAALRRSRPERSALIS